MGLVGLVLGAGGVVGGAFHAGVLAGIEEETGWDPRSAAVIVGTSAGSVTAASLRAGMPASDLAARAEGRPVSTEAQRLLAGVRARAPFPPLRPAGDRRLAAADLGAALRAARRPWSVRPGAVVAALLPPGTVSGDAISDGMDQLLGPDWPGERLWIPAVRLRDGARVVFGREDASATVGQAVAASCAIPGVFEPVEIGGFHYVDGGVHSPTNADVVGGERLDLVIVVSPMSMADRGLRLSADRPLRRWARFLLAQEVRGLKRRGTHVAAFEPTVQDQRTMGVNAMDPERRAPVSKQARASAAARARHQRLRELLAGHIS